MDLDFKRANLKGLGSTQFRHPAVEEVSKKISQKRRGEGGKGDVKQCVNRCSQMLLDFVVLKESIRSVLER